MSDAPAAAATESAELALLAIEGKVATLTLNRPEKRNALSLELLAAARARIDELAALTGGDIDPAKRPTVLVLAGAGRSFCAGMDLKAVLHEPGAPLKLLSAIAELTIALRRLPVVVLAKVNGAAIGGGCGLVAVADIAITHPDAKLGYPEVDLGVCPAVVAPWLHAALGSARARRVLLSGGTMSGHDAHQLGLVAHLCPAGELDERTRSITDTLAKAGARAVGETKRLLNRLDGERLEELVREGAHISADVIAGAEAQQRLGEVYGS